MENKNVLSGKASRNVFNAQKMINTKDAENAIRDIQRRHFEEGLYTEEEYQTLIAFYSKEKKRTLKKKSNNNTKNSFSKNKNSNNKKNNNKKRKK